MKINRERSDCFGRGFLSSNAFLNLFWDPSGGGPPNGWIDRAIVADGSVVPKSVGGAEWYVIEDATSHTEPYIVIANHSAANVAAAPNRFDDPHKIIKVTESNTAGRVLLDCYLWWDAQTYPSLGTGYGHWAGCYIETVDDGPFIYDFRGGPEFLSISANNNVNWDVFAINDWFADSNTKWFPYDKTVASAVVNAPTGTGASAFIELLDATEVDRFEIGKYYYLTDYNGVEKVEYVKVTGKDVTGPTFGVTVETIQSTAFAVGSVLAAYVHRYYAYFTNINGGSGSLRNQLIPYCSFYSSPVTAFYLNNIGIEFTPSKGFLNTMDPDDEGNTAIEEIFVNEKYARSGNTSEANNTLGKCVGVWMSSDNGLTQMQVGREINSLNYIFIEERDNFAMLIPDYDSNT